MFRLKPPEVNVTEGRRLQDKTIADAQAIKQEKIEITDTDKAAALELLKDEKLLDRILLDFDACGVVGERTNKLVGYLATTSRKLAKPLAIMVQSHRPQVNHRSWKRSFASCRMKSKSATRP